ncbi:MAG: hypothetical protein IKH64_02825, partial [Prevotella sp.]|nr:hypothetical protein [Prevotella sp.]
MRLPLGNGHLTAEELLVSEQKEKTPRPKSMSSYRVLIVDDDVEIGNYITQELGMHYRITSV